MSFLSNRITVIQNQITAYESAITFLITNPTKSYTLDTGQSRTTVTRVDLESLQNNLDILYNRLDVLDAIVNKTGTTISRPGW